MRSFLNKFFRFLLVSGLGWVLDFGIFTLLTQWGGLLVLWANYLSSLPAVTFVFFVSTRKTFVCRPDGLSLRVKYLLYVLYQAVLISLVSLVGEGLSHLLAHASWDLLAVHAKLAAKVLITPITMLCNFFVLRQITEKW